MHRRQVDDGRQWEALFRYALDAMLLADDRAGYVDANPAACALLGYRREELLAMSVWDITPDPDRDAGRAAWQAFIAAGHASGEYRVQGRDGTLREVEFRAVANIVPGVHLSILRDVSARRRAERDVLRSRERLRNLAARLDAVREAERASIAREIHDHLGQALTAISMDLAWLPGRLDPADEAAAARLRSMTSTVHDVIADVQAISARLRPAMLDDLGLEAAVEWQVREFNKHGRCRCSLELALDGVEPAREQATVAFRILQEGLTNVLRHAGARRVAVALRCRGGALELDIHDDGRGITGEEIASTGSIGLVGMRERAGAAGGRLSIGPGPAGGTVLRLRLPLADEAGSGAP